ncbi:MAG: DUF3179 domain-containing protein [Ardenticatenaceae bacterium]|nr:DUF3179 domain-containing protein [Ardenticatenaceae bacterium]
MYAATVNGQRLTFEVIGVWRRNMIMQDRETGTLWQQATGEALYGPLKGRQLELIGGEQTSWHDWVTRHPETAVSLEPPQPPRGLLSFSQIEFLLDTFTSRYKTPGLSPNDTRLPAHEEIGGLALNGAARAYPLSLMQMLGEVRDTLGGIPIVVRYDALNGRLSAYLQDENGRADTAHPLPIQRQFWLGWSEFHPQTTIFTTPIEDKS